MAKAVEEFAYKMMTEVLNRRDTAELGIEALLKAGSYDLGPKGKQIEKPEEWTKDKIIERGKGLGAKGSAGNFDD